MMRRKQKGRYYTLGKEAKGRAVRQREKVADVLVRSKALTSWATSHHSAPAHIPWPVGWAGLQALLPCQGIIIHAAQLWPPEGSLFSSGLRREPAHRCFEPASSPALGSLPCCWHKVRDSAAPVVPTLPGPLLSPLLLPFTGSDLPRPLSLFLLWGERGEKEQ